MAPSYDGESILPPDVLVPLLFALRGAYSSPALQEELRQVREKDTSQFHGTWRWSTEEHDFVVLVKNGASLRASGRLQDGQSWSASLEPYGDSFYAAAKTKGGFMPFSLQVRFEKDPGVEKSGILHITILSVGGNEVLGYFIARKAQGRCRFGGTSGSWEQQEILSKVQQPIFTSFGLPGPPAGVWVLLRSVVAHGDEYPEVTKIGSQCRRLLGQVSGELDDDDAIAAAACAGQDNLWALNPECLPPLPLESAVAVRSSKLHGEGLVACRSFQVGEEILREEPLAVLQCNFTPGANMRRAAMRLIGSGQVDIVLGSSLCRGPPDGTKAKELSELVDICLPNSSAKHRADFLEALRVFGFNAYATRDDSAQVLFKMICKANHSCSANASVVVPNSGPGQLVCIRPVAPAEEITVSYLNAKELHFERKERLLRLKRGWEFLCTCPTCASDLAP